MELYSVDNTIGGGFNRTDVIDEYISAIWTERFIEAGDATIVMPAVHKHLKLLAPGMLLGCQGSREIVLLDNRSIEGGLVTATGKTIENFFDERTIQAITMSAKAGDILKGVVNLMQDRVYWTISPRIRGLRVEDPDPGEPGPVLDEDVPAGPTYATLLTLAKKYNIGIYVEWTKIEDADHELVFRIRHGRDLTGDADGAVRFSPKLDNFANIKQLLSVAGSKNHALLISPSWVHPDSPNNHDVDGWGVSNYHPDGTVFQERVVEIDMNDISEDDEMFEGLNEVEKMNKLYRLMDARQFGVLQEKKKIKMVDGEVTPETQFVYKRDYNLGDKIDVEGDFGEPIEGVVTEYIRSSDETGLRSYPTVSTDADPPVGTGGDT
jgi:hypothetical protein